MADNEASDRTPEGPRSEQTDRPRSGPVVELALVAAGLGVVVHLLGYVDGIGSSSSLIVALLLGGGLLAGAVALPTVGARLLVPAAVAALTGALLLLQTVANGADSPVAIGALVLALLEAAAAGAAALLNAGVVRAPRPRPRKAAAPPQQPGFPPFAGQQYPAQQYPGQPYPGSYPGQPAAPYPGDQYAGEHAYAQYARYGAPYGVPGYPPPPPYPPPGYDPAGGRADASPSGAAFGEQQTAVTATGGYRPGVAAPTGEPGAVAPDVLGSGAYAARPANPSPSPTARLSGSHAAELSGSHAAVPEDSRPAGPEASYAAGPEGGYAGGSEGSYAGGQEGSRAVGPEGHYADGPEAADDRTRAIPRVSDEG